MNPSGPAETMKDKFDHYYRPTVDQFRRMWGNGLFVFDTNVLLNLYRYSLATRDQWLDVMRRLTDRIWLPHQAALEFHQNRLSVIHQQLKNHQEILRAISEAKEDLEGRLRSLYRDTAVEEDVVRTMSRRFEELRGDIQPPEGQSILETSAMEEDPVLAAITELFDRRVGDPMGTEGSEELLAEARDRYQQQVPPGFRDSDKEENRLGDLILWYQIITKAQQEHRPILLVTDDQKKDWWLDVGGKRIGPRPELIKEMREKADCEFYAYTPEQFLRLVREYLEADVSREAIGEVERLSLADFASVEEIRRLHAEIAATEHQLARSRSEAGSSFAELQLVEDLEHRAAELRARLDAMHIREADVLSTLASSTPADDTGMLETELQHIRFSIQELEMEIDRVTAGLDRRRRRMAELAESREEDVYQHTDRLSLLRRRLALAEQQVPADVIQLLRNEPPVQRPRRRGRGRRLSGEPPD